MSKQFFESLNNYVEENPKYLVSEDLIYEADDDGVFGKIIDRGLTFVPRAMRFKKAKKVMKKSLAGFTKKAKNVISKFSQGFKAKVDIIDREYKKLMKDKVVPLINDGKEEEAVNIIEGQLKELEDYKKTQMDILQKGIDDVLASYTSAIDKRIDSPGFVLNVELSEKGKGELKAKWEELVAIQKIEIDKYKTRLISSAGWRKLEEIESEMKSFIKQRKAVEADIDLSIQSIRQAGPGSLLVKVHVRTAHTRLNLKEKGLIIGKAGDEMEYSSGAKVIKDKGEYQFNARPYALKVPMEENSYVRPYLIFKEAQKPVYGDIADLEPFQEKEKGEGEIRIKGDKQSEKDGGIYDEKDIVQKENK